MRPSLPLAAALLALAAGCSAEPVTSPPGPVGQLIAGAARANGVPRDLMVAIAEIEGGLRLAPMREVHADELVVVAGVLELRRGRYDSLARGAALMGTGELEIAADLAKGTEAGARVLADLARDAGIRPALLADWAPVVETLSGHLARADQQAYRARVFRLLRAGGVAKARGGEALTIPAHPEIALGLTFAPPRTEAQGTPEYAGATWFETPQTNKWTPGRTAEGVTMIAIHDTEGGWNASVATLQNDPGKSVHYIIDADGGQVGQFIPEGDTAWHAGNWHYNQRMVGIEHVGFAGEDDYQTALYEKSADLVTQIAARHGLGPNGDGTALDRSVIVAHQEVPNGDAIAESSPPCPGSPGSCTQDGAYGGAGHHTDPGVFWEWCQYMEMLGSGSSCKCNDAYDLFNCVHDLSAMVRCPDGVVEMVHCADTCVVQPLGENDTCTPVSATTSSATTSGSVGGSGGGGTSSGPDGSSSDAGVGGSGYHGVIDDGALKQTGCAVARAGETGSLLAWSVALLASAGGLRRRRAARKWA